MFRGVVKLLRYNIKSLLKFEFIYKLLTIFIFSPLFSYLFKFIMKVNGYKYLTIENVKGFFNHTSTILMLIILLILAMLYMLFEISNIIIILDASRQKRKIRVSDSVKISFKKMINIFKYMNIGLIFFVLFLIPFLHIGATSSFLSVIKIPEFIMDFIESNILYFVTYILVMIILLITFFKWIYSFNYMILENLSFSKARKLSTKLGEKKHFKDLLKLLVTEGLIYLLYFVFIFVGALLIVLMNKFLTKLFIVNSLLITLIWLFMAYSFILFSLVSIPISFASISYLFYKHKTDRNEEIKGIDFNKIEEAINNEEKPYRISKLKFIVILVLIFSGTIFTYGVQNKDFDLNIKYKNSVEVTAHRGASKYYPENTMAAFKGAKKLGADWVELDVQQTKDGKIIVIHDHSFKRTTGVNKNTWELTYDEVAKLDAGSSFNSKYKNERIPLLEDIIIWANENNIKLNIELKPTGHETNFEQNVIDIIKEHDFEKKCVITSGTYSVLENTKKIDKDIKTVYVMSLAYGDILKFKYADGFSIEATNINKKLVKKIHKNKKEIFVWTVNKESSISKMVKLGVDNIITDDITYAKDVIKKSNDSDVITEYVKKVQSIF